VKADKKPVRTDTNFGVWVPPREGSRIPYQGTFEDGFPFPRWDMFLQFPGGYV